MHCETKGINFPNEHLFLLLKVKRTVKHRGSDRLLCHVHWSVSSRCEQRDWRYETWALSFSHWCASCYSARGFEHRGLWDAVAHVHQGMKCSVWEGPLFLCSVIDAYLVTECTGEWLLETLEGSSHSSFSFKWLPASLWRFCHWCVLSHYTRRRMTACSCASSQSHQVTIHTREWLHTAVQVVSHIRSPYIQENDCIRLCK